VWPEELGKRMCGHWSLLNRLPSWTSVTVSKGLETFGSCVLSKLWVGGTWAAPGEVTWREYTSTPVRTQ
jgi:hypothetical protein